MFAYIKGELAEVDSDRVVVDVNGIAFEVLVAPTIHAELPPIGNTVKLHTHFQLREDSMTLYGFLEKEDLEMFRQLITVNGIGPKGGLAILSTLSADDLRFAILSGDAKAIAKAPGIGAKTAQRLILDLKDKVNLEDAVEKKLSHGEKESGASSAGFQTRNDAVLALTALGYSQTESLKAVSKVEITEGMDVEEVLKRALKHMSLF